MSTEQTDQEIAQAGNGPAEGEVGPGREGRGAFVVVAGGQGRALHSGRAGGAW